MLTGVIIVTMSVCVVMGVGDLAVSSSLPASLMRSTGQNGVSPTVKMAMKRVYFVFFILCSTGL